MNIVFCVDPSVLPGLHVAAYSLLERMHPAADQTRFTIFSETLDDSDMALLQQTLGVLTKRFKLELRRVDGSGFAKFPPLNDSWATYYRLFAARICESERLLYLDADTLCDVDVSELNSLDMRDTPVAWVPEAPLSRAVDRNVAEYLGNSEAESYFNAGVMLMNVAEWRRQKISERAMEYIAAHRPAFHDQSALNFVLHRNALDEKYNCMSNMRKNWPAVQRPYGSIGRLVHFLDYPKPWDFLGEWVHPQYRLWHSVLNQTAMRHFQSWRPTASRRLPKTRKAWIGYKKALKDRILFAGYRHGWLRRVKGVPIISPAESVL